MSIFICIYILWIVAAFILEYIDRLRAKIEKNRPISKEYIKNNDPIELLSDAISYTNVDHVKKLLELNINSNIYDNIYEYSKLLKFVLNTKLQKIELLPPSNKHIVNQHNKKCYEIIDLLFRYGAKLNDIQDYFRYQLVEADKFELVELLLKYGADIDKDYVLHDEIHYKCRVDVVVFLLAHGANVNIRNKEGKLPIEIASEYSPWPTPYSHWDTPDDDNTRLYVINLLIEYGADINKLGDYMEDRYNCKDVKAVNILLSHNINYKYVENILNKNKNDSSNPCYNNLVKYLEKHKPISQPIFEKSESKIHQTLQNKQSLEQLLPENQFSGWFKLNNKPFYFFYYYFPKRYIDITDESKYVRELIYKFKDGIWNYDITRIIIEKLMDTIGFVELSDFTFVYIPASTEIATEKRFAAFSAVICVTTGMRHGNAYIKFIHEKTPKHLGGTGQAIFEFDKKFFKGKKVILFDDVVTSGKSMKTFINELQKVDAEVVCQIAIGCTFNQYRKVTEPVHPHTGNKGLISHELVNNTIPF